MSENEQPVERRSFLEWVELEVERRAAQLPLFQPSPLALAGLSPVHAPRAESPISFCTWSEFEDMTRWEGDGGLALERPAVDCNQIEVLLFPGSHETAIFVGGR
jgi:hypothetical protein